MWSISAPFQSIIASLLDSGYILTGDSNFYDGGRGLNCYFVFTNSVYPCN